MALALGFLQGLLHGPIKKKMHWYSGSSKKTMSSQEIGAILENSRELDRLRKDQEGVLSDINKIHKKLQIS
ncbi:hypothetical protein SADUNF_Sadunf16G0219400 [Salix dunnii]|uniref:Uncharacterized protein n=1 Tax=Salix dunnii TaxID=1413687 RepID=A0A835JFN3_9ROSI|nr:hypothetical protein SADUNF_Sadunf16G0219400 [Salix dunnii]